MNALYHQAIQTDSSDYLNCKKLLKPIKKKIMNRNTKTNSLLGNY